MSRCAVFGKQAARISVLRTGRCILGDAVIHSAHAQKSLVNLLYSSLFEGVNGKPDIVQNRRKKLQGLVARKQSPQKISKTKLIDSQSRHQIFVRLHTICRSEYMSNITL